MEGVVVSLVVNNSLIDWFLIFFLSLRFFTSYANQKFNKKKDLEDTVDFYCFSQLVLVIFLKKKNC